MADPFVNFELKTAYEPLGLFLVSLNSHTDSIVQCLPVPM